MKIEKGKLYYHTALEKLEKAEHSSDIKDGLLTDKIAVYCPTKADWDYVDKTMNWDWEYHQGYEIRLLNNKNRRIYSVEEAKQEEYHIITIYEFKEFYPPQVERCVNEKDNMKIEKGNKFLCTKDVIMFDGDIAYKKGEIYHSEIDGCITNINREYCHRWTSEDAPHFYFKPLKEVDRLYTDATDRIRELYDNYTGDKFGSPSNARYFGTKLSDGEPLFILARDGYINPFLTYDYVTEDTFIELMVMNDNTEEDYDDPYNWVVNGMRSGQEVFNPKPYYDNSKGSLYKVASERGWGAYLFDVVKRLERGGKKDPLRQEIEKSIDVLKIWLNEID